MPGSPKSRHRLTSRSRRAEQEFLVARYLATRLEADQVRILRDCSKNLLSDDWMEPVRFLSERLASRNPDRFDRLLSFLSSSMSPKDPTDQARMLVLMRLMAINLSDSNRIFGRPEYKALLGVLEPLVFSSAIQQLDPNVRIQVARCYGALPDPRLSVLDWVSIRGGSFHMGAQKDNRAQPRFDERARPDESPVRKVFVPSFQITRYPVTVKQYRKFIEEHGYDREEFWKDGAFGQFGSPSKWSEQQQQLNCPVVGVSWYEAAAFCYWAGACLPSEVEWERAAAGIDGRIYPWGNEEPTQRLAYFGTQSHAVAPLGLFPEGQTADGVFDLAGNTWEWVYDLYGPCATDQNRAGSETQAVSNTRRVLRGGSNISARDFLRCSERTWLEADHRYSAFGPVGFRCARPEPH